MAGWDQVFDVHPDDSDLFRLCMRILRRTCARHRVEMDYYLERNLPSGRRRYIIEYNLHSSDLGIACGEFVIEMRTLALVQTSPRRTRLPLRLMRDVAYSAVYTLDEQIADGYVTDIPIASEDALAQVLTDYQTSYWAWAVGVLPDADFLEVQHSTVVNLALDRGRNAHTRDSYPVLIQKLPIDEGLRDDLRNLGEVRNRVKHRKKRQEATKRVSAGVDALWRLSAQLTGFYPDPVPPSVRELVDDPSSAFLTPPMYWRSGERRIIRH